ncbi:MAG: NAD-dependent epimerase/dehydratase family protein, partial [Dehalococcoidales bacterium]|nr:NAD-dependent epimerase/dehydratase family protein [Dehalococcoidales bacterium]
MDTYLDNKNILLTGATGMAGSGIINYLLDKHPATKIRAVFCNTRPFIDHERVEYVRADLRSRDDCRSIAKGCDCAIMAAANSAGSKAISSKPWEQVNDNVVMNINMLQALHSENVRRVVYIGSATLYQEFQGDISEEALDLNIDPPQAYFGIGWGFRFTEKLCEFWHRHTGMEIAIVRAANIFGPYAKFDPEVSNFIPAIIRKAADKLDPFEVWG